jgi:hypothetical protein
MGSANLVTGPTDLTDLTDFTDLTDPTDPTVRQTLHYRRGGSCG